MGISVSRRMASIRESASAKASDTGQRRWDRAPRRDSGSTARALSAAVTRHAARPSRRPGRLSDRTGWRSLKRYPDPTSGPWSECTRQRSSPPRARSPTARLLESPRLQRLQRLPSRCEARFFPARGSTASGSKHSSPNSLPIRHKRSSPSTVMERRTTIFGSGAKTTDHRRLSATDWRARASRVCA